MKKNLKVGCLKKGMKKINKNELKERMNGFIQDCYEEIPSSIRYTLNRLNSNSEFHSTIQILRTEGWCDWQLLGAIKGIILHYRNERYLTIFSNIDELYSFLVNKSKQTENIEDPTIPSSEFSVDHIRNVLNIGIEPIIKQFGKNNVFLDIDHKNPFT